MNTPGQPAQGGQPGQPAQGGQPGMDVNTAFDLAMTNAKIKKAQDQADLAAQQDEDAKNKATLPPYHYQNNVGYHQVRNPDYGRVPGAPMYFQYFDTGTTGDVYTGPGQGGVRDMTPTELQYYRQTGQFKAGAASGGLTDLLKKKVLLMEAV